MTIQDARNLHHKFYNAKEIIEKVGATSKRNEKEKILKDNIDNELLKRIMYYTYNDDLVYNVSDRTLEVIGDMLEGQQLMSMAKSRNIFELLDYLSENNLSNETIEEIVLFYQESPKDLLPLYSSMILKNLRVGISVKTVNKIWKGLIPTFELMRAHKLEGNERLIKNKDFALTLKLNGVRGAILVDKKGNITIKTRQNKIIEGLTELEEELKNLPRGFMYDGELLCTDNLMESTNEMYRKTAGVINNKEENKTGVYFHMFDMVDLKEFMKGKCTLSYKRRREMIDEIVETEHLKVVPLLYMGSEIDKIDEISKDAVSKGLEGIMLNFTDGVYECKRSKAILKVKPTYTLDLKIVRAEEGKPNGKYKGKLGSLIVDYKGNEVGVGTGFSDKDRTELWEMKDELVGKIVEIGHKGETVDKITNNPSLNYATFVRIRNDKDEVSYD